MAEINIAYHPKQAEFLFDPARVKVVVKGRRFGGTHGLANFVSESLLDGKYKKVLWGDVSLGNAKKYWTRYFQPFWKQVPDSLWAYHKQENEFRYKDSYIDFRGADYPDGWEGFGYDCIILNEAGIILTNDYLWYNAVLPMSLEHNADIVVLGTPKGKRGLYYELAQRAMKALDGWKLFKFTSYDNPWIPVDRIKELEATMPSTLARQEIHAEFIDDSGAVFRNVEECSTEKELPPEQDESYYMGLDLAKSSDYTVIKIMKANGVEVYSERFNDVDWSDQKLRIAAAADRYNRAQILVDKTGVGDPILEDLQNMGLNITGLHFTNESKFNLIKNLILGFENKKIRIINDTTTKEELKNFEYKITASARIKYEARSGHDDTVIALALAYYQIRESDIPTMRQVPAASPVKLGGVQVSGGKWTKLREFIR